MTPGQGLLSPGTQGWEGRFLGSRRVGEGQEPPPFRAPGTRPSALPRVGHQGRGAGQSSLGARSRVSPNGLPCKARRGGAPERSSPASRRRPRPEKFLRARRGAARRGAGPPASVQGAEGAARAAGGPASARSQPPGRPLCPSSLLPCPPPAAPKPLPRSPPAPRPPPGGSDSAGPGAPRPSPLPALPSSFSPQPPPGAATAGLSPPPPLPSSFVHGSGSSASFWIPPSPSAPGGPAPRCL